MKCFLLALFAVLSISARAEDLSYFPPGDILPSNTSGIRQRTVTFPDWTFPIKIGTTTGQRAYIGTQLSQYHKLKWANDPRLFAYPHRDNQCEPRQWKLNACPGGKGHQGVDIRATDNRDKFWEVVAVEDGVVSILTRNTTVGIRNGVHTVRYLHMDPASIAAAGIKLNAAVRKGQVLGKVSNVMNGSKSTSIHLHFDAYSGVASAGNFFHVYPSLIAAYRRGWGMDDGIRNGELVPDPVHETRVGAAPAAAKPPAQAPAAEKCAGVAVASPLPSAADMTISSYWLYNCSVLALVADTATGARSLFYYQPTVELADLVASNPVLFSGTVSSGIYAGEAKVYSGSCGTLGYAVSGPVQSIDGQPVITLRGDRPTRNSRCETTGTSADTLTLTYLGTSAPALKLPPITAVAPSQPATGTRTTLSEQSRNFLAITFYPAADGSPPRLLPYFSNFPGLSPEEGPRDSRNGVIPRLKTDEAGVAISWVWLRKRALYTDGLALTPRQVAHSMAGVEPSMCDTADINPTAAALRNFGVATAVDACARVAAYLRGYIGFANGRNFASDYFGRNVGIDETLNLAVEADAFNWMRTMYSHESGKAAVVDAATFGRGIRFGEDYIAAYYDNRPDALHPLAYYSDPCNFGQPNCGTSSVEPQQPIAASSPVAANSGPAGTASSPETLESLTRAVRDLEARLARLEARPR
ncbi:M23 family metallopeptidase [Aureimonas leprariae]|uniref:M23 family metallopeptidase n=1 Tax=Plantimonas leprariae TaxID=2615207 RepID=UPI001AEE365F|nr:M23 family metallopeptidase [Aureimonas leprariae]